VQLIVAADAEQLAQRAADWLAICIRTDITERGRASVALSGGTTPWRTFALLAGERLDWERVQIAQVDERVVPLHDRRRNLATLRATFVEHGALPAENLLGMPVEDVDVERAAERYSGLLRDHGIDAFDVVQLGLGQDGHTASLLPDDPLLEESTRPVGVSSELDGLRRMTLTLPTIARARRVLWLVSGAAKHARLAELLRGGARMPAGRVSPAHAIVIADQAAAQRLSAADVTA
jgi:6-phosphogluconolactonase